MTRLLQVLDLSKSFHGRTGETRAIQELSFSVEEREFVCIVGPSGCGKTTLLKVISGLESPSGGSVMLSEKLVGGPYQDVGFVFQRAVLMEWRSAMENVMLPIELQRKKKSDYASQASRLLDLFGLSGFHSKYPRELSGGMQQRVAIARALIHDPALLLLDEPLSSLDELTREQMSSEFLKLSETLNKTVILVTHSVSEAVFLGDRVLVLTPRPSRLTEDIRIDLPHPRGEHTRTDPAYSDFCQRVRSALRRNWIDAGGPDPQGSS